MGHVARDVVPDARGWRPGGSVYYAAAAASTLGHSVGVVTAGAAREVDALRALPNTVVLSLDAKRSTSFENLDGPSGRRQVLHALAPPIPPEIVPSEWRKAATVLLAPIADEVPLAAIKLFPQALIGVAPQGWMRQLTIGQEVRFRSWNRAEDVLSQVATAIFSEEDVHGHPAWLGYCGAVLVMTRGELGCDVIHCGKQRHVPGFPAQEVDATGAGDVFAAAYMLRLHETRDPLDAARFANCVASFSVAEHGIDALPTLDQVQERLA